MKRFYIIALLFLTVLPLKAIKEIPVDFECNIHTINKEESDAGRTFTLDCEDGGWCVIKKSNHPNQKVGYGGLYIFRSPFTNEWDEPQFYCLDLLCTICASKGITSLVHKYTLWDVQCDKCGNIFNATNGKSVTSKTKLSLLTYPVDVVSDGWIRVHNDEGLEQRNMLLGDTPY